MLPVAWVGHELTVCAWQGPPSVIPAGRPQMCDRNDVLALTALAGSDGGSSARLVPVSFGF